jgi:predicted dehydrogenase
MLDAHVHRRFFLRKLGGGAMHDMGSYLVQFSLMFLFDDPKQVDIQASTVMSDDENIDLETAFVLSHRGKTAQFATSLRRPSEYDIEVFGTHGMLVSGAHGLYCFSLLVLSTSALFS